MVIPFQDFELGFSLLSVLLHFFWVSPDVFDGVCELWYPSETEQFAQTQ